MTILFTLIAVLQSFSISLGVGSSTLAITNFFAAIADGTIDETERRMMGIVYVVLRIAMMGILITMAAQVVLQWYAGTLLFTGPLLAQGLIVAMLFLNAILMTKHVVPSTIGPGLQAGSWYALGALQAMALQGITVAAPYFITFLLAYIAWVVLAIGIVNGVMAVLKSRKQKPAA